MKESELFNNLNIFFKRFNNNIAAGDIKEQFLFCLKGLSSRKGICDEIDSLKAVYEMTLRFIEKEAADSAYKKDLLALQRGLYLELEYILSFEHSDLRHHFLVVIPVADRPIMLKNCLGSLIEQCRMFQYGGFTINEQGIPVYNKISVVVIDDSKDRDNIQKIKDICAETVAAGIQTYYLGLDEQTELLRHVPSEYREQLRDLIGDIHKPAPPHKGASLSRNIAYLYLHLFLDEFREKALIYFLDSDEEFRVKIKRGSHIEDIHFINYFYWLDKLFETRDVEVVTGKVVGDPPVSPSVMINTFLEDITLFLGTISGAAPDEKCTFHDNRSNNASAADYHDMVKLFGYNGASHPKKYSCSLTGDHSVKDCLEDFSKKALGFFYGLHPTRTQFYLHRDDFTETENARTVYTGNYVFRTTGLRHFIPFANLKLRMAGPALGRILRKKLKHRFASANLPLLHKRTIQADYSNEFRSGISADKTSIDLSLEFNRQFWGDVMLFSVEKLSELGYPEKRLGLSEITKTAYQVQDKLWNLYKKRQNEIARKTAKIENYLLHKPFWWHRETGAERSVENILLFCTLVDNNFGAQSASLQKISAQIREGSYINTIINAIHSFYEIDIAWNELLKADIAASFASGGCIPSSGS
ncbi:MAG: hypothetical protein EHM54_05180 [Nitrospiraceae bacterium]|nr:MAG: hypothetical protein EHM54_05180 [Nitrospiraceae bacterium]